MKNKSNKNLQNDIIITVIISLLVVLTRIPFLSKYLYEWDSVNYALGFENFNILNHQPHPPGYILYIELGKFLNFAINDANSTMVFISVLFSVLTVILVYFLATEMFSRKYGVIAAILLIFNPLFWYYGEIATIYPSEAFFATLIALLSYKVFNGKEKYFFPSIIALGLAGGFRQDLIIFMFPLWMFCLFYNNRNPTRFLKALMVLIPVVLLWFIPTTILSGGYASYSEASATLYRMCFPRSSLIFGASLANQFSALGAYLSWSGIGLTFIGIFVIALFNKYRGIGPIDLFRRNIKNSKIIFITLWILPPSLIYILIHIAKPGYVTVFVPILAIILAYFVDGLSKGLNTAYGRYSAKKWMIIIVSVMVIFNSAFFLLPFNISQEKVWETPLNTMNASQGVLWGIDTSFMYNREKINANDHSTEVYLDSIKKVPDSNKDNTIIVIGEISRVNEGFNWRKAMYYLPDYSIYYLIESDGFIISPWYAKNHSNIWLNSNQFNIKLNKSTTKIIWIISDKSKYYPQITSQINLNTINLVDGKKIYYSDLKEKRIKNDELIINGPKQF